ncbi:DUF1254 domain-containing protein [Bdellovibrio bacteriovorus]|uniref:DUF1254 domain-containing protein n=1 Tax=Bdellovibrio bacteriovorus TaxID=959 RepID=UPI003AA99091
MKSLVMAFVLLFSGAALAVDTEAREYTAAREAYRQWYPTVSMEGIMNGMRQLGVRDNVNMFSAQADSKTLGFTANQDTPYGAAVVDLTKGPFVVDMPAGPFMGLVNAHDQSWIIDMGIPGQDAGKGGKYLIVPEGYKGQIPQGYYVGKSDTNKVFVVARIIPQGNDLNKAQKQLAGIKIYPLSAAKNPKPLSIIDISGRDGDLSSLKWEGNIQFWEKLAKVINEEPVNKKKQAAYDQLKALGIEKGKAFKPNASLRSTLDRAAQDSQKELLASSYATTGRPDKVKWSDRKWEWLLLSSKPEWAADHDSDAVARDRYFAQAIVMSPAMLRRDSTAGSLYWGAFKDSNNNALDGGKSYKLTVPLPVPSRLFWSVTLYDSDTRSLIANGTKKSSLRSLVELADLKGAKSVDLFFGPQAPAGKEAHWVKTSPGKTWFAYFRIYGPEKAAFDNTWKPGDFVQIQSESMALNQ